MCDICNDAGRLRYDVPIYDPNFGKTYPCECQKLKIAQGIQSRIGTPFDTTLRLSSVKVRGDGSREMKAAGSDFLSRPTASLTIWGTNGNGKSTCLQAMVNECLDRGVTALYMANADLMDFLKAGIGDDEYDVEDRMNVLCTIPVLCVDEISGTNFTDWVQEKFGTLIDRRYRLELGTLLAMDEDPGIFLHRRIFSRLREGVIVVNKDSDMRPSIGAVKARS